MSNWLGVEHQPEKTNQREPNKKVFWVCESHPGCPGVGRVISTASLVSLMVLVARLLDGALALPLGLTSAVCTTAIMCLGVELKGWIVGGWKMMDAIVAFSFCTKNIEKLVSTILVGCF